MFWNRMTFLLVFQCVLGSQMWCGRQNICRRPPIFGSLYMCTYVRIHGRHPLSHFKNTFCTSRGRDAHSFCHFQNRRTENREDRTGEQKRQNRGQRTETCREIAGWRDSKDTRTEQTSFTVVCTVGAGVFTCIHVYIYTYIHHQLIRGKFAVCIELEHCWWISMAPAKGWHAQME